jgi:GNAT superfamily N-acetyltransferase
MPAADLGIRPAGEADVPAVLALIRALAEYEHAAPGTLAITEALLREAMFGSPRAVEVLLASLGEEIAGFAMFFHNFSSWRGRRGIFLEDLFVRPEMRRRGVAGRSWRSWPVSPWRATARVSSGWWSTGTSRPSIFTTPWERHPLNNGLPFASAVPRSKPWPRYERAAKSEARP